MQLVHVDAPALLRVARSVAGAVQTKVHIIRLVVRNVRCLESSWFVPVADDLELDLCRWSNLQRWPTHLGLGLLLERRILT